MRQESAAYDVAPGGRSRISLLSGGEVRWCGSTTRTPHEADVPNAPHRDPSLAFVTAKDARTLDLQEAEPKRDMYRVRHHANSNTGIHSISRNAAQVSRPALVRCANIVLRRSVSCGWVLPSWTCPRLALHLRGMARRDSRTKSVMRVEPKPIREVRLACSFLA